jgi:hypothetical protein
MAVDCSIYDIDHLPAASYSVPLCMLVEYRKGRTGRENRSSTIIQCWHNPQINDKQFLDACNIVKLGLTFSSGLLLGFGSPFVEDR